MNHAVITSEQIYMLIADLPQRMSFELDSISALLIVDVHGLFACMKVVGRI